MPIVIDGTGTISGLSAGGLPSASVTQTTLATPVAGTGPAFLYTPSATTTLSANTWTKINYATKQYDTANAVSSSRFTPQVAGYYQIQANFGEGLSTANMAIYIAIYKNGGSFSYMQYVTSSAWYQNVPVANLVYFNGTTDYVEIYAYTASAYTNQTNGGTNNFSGFLVRAA